MEMYYPELEESKQFIIGIKKIVTQMLELE